jgi:tRNA-dihydrouridine synthase
VSIPVAVNGDIGTFEDAAAALRLSGADAVMIGRGAQGRSWFPGQVARFLTTGKREAPPALEIQRSLIEELYTDLLAHHGTPIGLRHARKHLAWSLDAAAATVNAPPGVLKDWRTRVLTAEDPQAVLRLLPAAYAALSDQKASAASDWRVAA